MERALGLDSDIAILQAMINGPDVELTLFLQEHPEFTTTAQARDDLVILVARLKDLRAGRVVTHAEMVKDVEARRRVRIQAAE